MTISYSLTRIEVIQTFLYVLTRSVRILFPVMATSATPGLIWILGPLVSHRNLTPMTS